jgi:hypothetical protein
MQSRGRKIYYKFLQTLLASSLSLTNLVASAPAFSADKSPIEIGIDRSNLSDQKEDVRKKTIEDIHALGAQWFRDGSQTVGGEIAAAIRSIEGSRC